MISFGNAASSHNGLIPLKTVYRKKRSHIFVGVPGTPSWSPKLINQWAVKQNFVFWFFIFLKNHIIWPPVRAQNSSTCCHMKAMKPIKVFAPYEKLGQCRRIFHFVKMEKGTKGTQGGHRGHRDTRDTWDTRDTRDTGTQWTQETKGTQGTQKDTRGYRGHKGHRGHEGIQGDTGDTRWCTTRVWCLCVHVLGMCE